jgi:predicted lipoprotein with Yx(FWY)xxD motif
MFATRKSLPAMFIALVVGLSAIVVGSAPAQQAPPAPLKTAQTKELGTFLVDAKGMTLYIFDNDKDPGKSTCNEGCAKAWPPFGPKAGDPAPVAPLSVITRDDGSKQYAYKGKPLYYYAKDQKAGDTTGQAVGKRWWVVKP